MWFALIATIVVGALLYKYFLSNSKSFWAEHGIPEVDTSAVVSKLDFILGKKSQLKADDYAYEKIGPGPFCGTMEVTQPVLIVKDEELIKKILIKDFNYFVDRRSFFTESDGSIKKMLFTLEGEEWKGVRTSLSPTFTTGKIRRMMESFNAVGKEWVKEFTRKAKSNPSGSVNIDVASSVNQYTLEVIFTTAFGINAGIITNPGSIFIKMADRVTDFGKFLIMKIALRQNFPKFCKFLGFPLLDTESLSFFQTILDKGLQSRLKGETKRNDFLQLLVEARKGELKAAESDELSSFEKEAMLSENSVPKKQYLTDEVMSAQSITFFFAGFSTTSNFITFALYVLSLHQDIQEKLRQEVAKIVKEDGSLDYDDVGQLVYMDMVVCEVLRKFPAVGRLERICAKDYKDPESGLVLPKGALVGIPVNAIHHDKKYYDNPDNFDPEHFTPEKKAARNPYAFIPFGMGPRNCIGMRFALTEVKSALAHMIHSFIIEPTAKTPVPIKVQPAGVQVIPPKNLELKLTPLDAK